DLFIAYEPKPEAKHPDMVPSVQHLHGKPVALSDPGDQDVVRNRRSAQFPSRRFGRSELAGGSMRYARFFNLSQKSARLCDLPHKDKFSASHGMRDGRQSP